MNLTPIVTEQIQREYDELNKRKSVASKILATLIIQNRVNTSQYRDVSQQLSSLHNRIEALIPNDNWDLMKFTFDCDAFKIQKEKFYRQKSRLDARLHTGNDKFIIVGTSKQIIVISVEEEREVKTLNVSKEISDVFIFDTTIIFCTETSNNKHFFNKWNFETNELTTLPIDDLFFLSSSGKIAVVIIPNGIKIINCENLSITPITISPIVNKKYKNSEVFFINDNEILLKFEKHIIHYQISERRIIHIYDLSDVESVFCNSNLRTFFVISTKKSTIYQYNLDTYEKVREIPTEKEDRIYEFNFINNNFLFYLERENLKCIDIQKGELIFQTNLNCWAINMSNNRLFIRNDLNDVSICKLEFK